jgi:hypothetical protein
MANDPIVFFMPDPEQDPASFIDSLVAEGRLANRDRVLVVRWMTVDEQRSL